ncbi:hypothetical protein Mal64_32630 [Pseudobythopirellula maris]|uniref:Uncharacterized protein n=1 Tax=Pseudobythopirellula maris TaxID=2527991 RepID=A0A5C5ZKH1_9BACT|nr:hypothetical protein [Pseudobythopirellula maris]TWT87720.1 hypothetical protein Mal64_32630 [Pseudobythopirellula maris]
MPEHDSGAKPDEINPGHYFELLDRVHVTELYLDTALRDHPVLQKHDDLNELFESAAASLAELYQRIGGIDQTWEPITDCRAKHSGG